MVRLIDADDYLAKERPRGVADDIWEESHVYKSITNAPTVEAIPKAEVRKLLRDNADKVSDSMLDIVKEDYIHKADYETRLKADLVAMLEDLDLQIDESGSYNREVAKVQRLIRDKINKLRGE